MTLAIDLTKVKLPSLPAAAVRVLDLVQDPDVDVQSLGKVIELDAALAARLVRLSNSSLFGLTREITSVRQALVILGLRTVKLAALSFTLIDSLGKNAKHQSLAQCWRQILTNAMASRLLGPMFHLDPEEAFLAGLMLDIGSLVCAQSLGKDFVKLVDQSLDESKPDLEELEREILGYDHIDVSTKLMKHWRMPKKLIDAIEAHRELDLAQAFAENRRDLDVLLVTAKTITGFLLKPSIDHLERFTLVSDGFGKLSSEIDKFLQKLEIQVAEMAELLELNLPAGQSLEQILAKAQELSKDLRVESREQLPLRVRQELARAKREKCPLGLVLVRLKTVSKLSKAGMATEAERLQSQASKILQEATRECDVLFRLNLSTYSILAPNTPPEGIENVIQRLIPKLQATGVNVDDQFVPLDFSFGVVVHTPTSPDDVNVESFLLKANDNLTDAVERDELLVSTVF